MLGHGGGVLKSLRGLADHQLDSCPVVRYSINSGCVQLVHRMLLYFYFAQPMALDGSLDHATQVGR